MSGLNFGSGDLIAKALRAGAEAMLAVLNGADAAGPSKPAAPASTGDNKEGLIEFDPLHDEPPFAADPKGTDAEMKMAYVTYLGAIGRFNAEEESGATKKEIPEFAKRAGYSDGKAVNGWNSRPGSPRAVENVNGERFLNDAALGWIEKDAAKLGIKLVGEFATVPAPK